MSNASDVSERASASLQPDPIDFIMYTCSIAW